MKKLLGTTAMCLAICCITLAPSKITQTALKAGEDDPAYIVEDSILIKTSAGHTLSAVMVRKKDIEGPHAPQPAAPQPAALFFYIDSNLEANIREAKSAADHGYVGIVADVRGKRLSPDQLVPYENEQEDVYEVIEVSLMQKSLSR